MLLGACPTPGWLKPKETQISARSIQLSQRERERREKSEERRQGWNEYVLGEMKKEEGERSRACGVRREGFRTQFPIDTMGLYSLNTLAQSIMSKSPLALLVIAEKTWRKKVTFPVTILTVVFFQEP